MMEEAAPRLAEAEKAEMAAAPWEREAAAAAAASAAAAAAALPPVEVEVAVEEGK